MKDVTIVLQGRVNPEQMELWKKNYKDWNVIVSTWEDVDFDFNGGIFSKWLPKKWKLIINKYPLVRFRPQANLDYQIITTLSGLNEVKTKWVIKARCDEYWSNLDKVIDKIKKHPEKIVCSSMYFRKWGLYKFHISDKIIAGNIDNLKLMFESTLHNLDLNFYSSSIPESQLGLGYIVAKEPQLDLEDLSYRLNLELLGVKESDSVITKDEVSEAITKIMNHSVNIFSEHLTLDSKNIEWDVIKNKMELISSISSYCINKLEKNKYKPFDDKKLMKKWFEIIDINELKPYVCTRQKGIRGSGDRIWFRDNFDNEKEDSMTNIHQD